MNSNHRHLFDDDGEEEEYEEEEEEDVHMYSADMNPNERADYRAACRASKASEWNRQQQ